MLEHVDHLAETAAKAISNIKFDKVIVWEGGGNGVSNTAGFLQNMARTLPPMMQMMKEIGGVELPEFMGRLSPDGGDNKEAVPMRVPIVAVDDRQDGVETVAAPEKRKSSE